MSDESSQVPPTFDQLVMPHQELDVEMVEVRARLNQGQKSLTNKTDESMEAARCSRAEPTFICTDKITHCFACSHLLGNTHRIQIPAWPTWLRPGIRVRGDAHGSRLYCRTAVLNLRLLNSI